MSAELEALRAALRSVNAVAIERGDKYGVCDQIDNDGEPYQSQWFADLLKDATAAASPAQPAQQDSRAEFEAVIAASNDFTDWTKEPDGEYQQPLVRLAWKYWQAARSAPRPVLTDAEIDEIAIAHNLPMKDRFNCQWGYASEVRAAIRSACERVVREGGGNE